MCKFNNLPPSCATVTKSGNVNFLKTSGPVQACNGTALPLTLHYGVKSLYSVVISGTYMNVGEHQCMCGRQTVLQGVSHYRVLQTFPKHSVLLLTDIFKLIVMSQEMFGPIFRTWRASQPQVHLLQPEDVEVRSSREVSAQWLRCCTANRKVAGSIPAGVIGFFIDIKSFRSH